MPGAIHRQSKSAAHFAVLADHHFLLNRFLVVVTRTLE